MRTIAEDFLITFISPQSIEMEYKDDADFMKSREHDSFYDRTILATRSHTISYRKTRNKQRIEINQARLTQLTQLKNRMIDWLANTTDKNDEEWLYFFINDIDVEIQAIEKRLGYISCMFTTREIKQADLEELRAIPLERVAESLGLKRPQTLSKAYLCPFHHEKTPSLHFFTKNNRFRCFGCGQHGSPIDLVMGITKGTVKEAINYLSNIK